MNLGYACITLGIDVKYRTCRIKNATYENLYEITKHNLQTLDQVIEYNFKNKIFLFRISSDIIPFGSKEEINFNWQKLFKEELNNIGLKIKKYKIRVSMHPGQYTVLNSNNDDVVKRAILDLRYHCDFLNLLGVNNTSKIVMHVGGVYGDKEPAKFRFIHNFEKLDLDIKKRLVIENDEKNFNIEDVLEIAKKIKIPVVFDNLHHLLNNKNKQNLKEVINKVSKTWMKEDGVQKIHYSQQALNQKHGAHSQTINIPEFIAFYEKIKDLKIDIMLEVKDKDLSVKKVLEKIR